MTDMNVVAVHGRLTRDCEQKATKEGLAIIDFAIAVQERKEEVSYFDCRAFGKLAENLFSYLKKGKELNISGKLKQSRWEANGEKKAKVYIVAEAIQLLGSKEKTDTETKTASDDDIPW